MSEIEPTSVPTSVPTSLPAPNGACFEPQRASVRAETLVTTCESSPHASALRLKTHNVSAIVPDPTECVAERRSETRDVSTQASAKHPTAASLLLSTFLSLVVVLVLLVALRTMLPSMLEFSRYAWHRGQLRAEYEMAGQQLERVSWEGLSQVSQTVAKRISPSVVHITMSMERDDLDPSLEEMVRSAPRRSKVGQGSGTIVDKRGFILTNYHVLDDGSQINVILADERTCVAELIGFDKLTDLAVIKIRRENGVGGGRG